MDCIRGHLAACLVAALCATTRSQPPAPRDAPRADARMKVRDGLRLWVDAGAEQVARSAAGLAPLVAGQDVDRWHDLSGRDRHLTQRVRAARPTWETGPSGPTLRFDGDDFLEGSGGLGPASREATVLIVAAPASNDGGFRALVSTNRAGGDDFITGLNIDLGDCRSDSWSVLNVEGAGQSGAADLLRADVPFDRFHVVVVRTRPGPAGTEVWLDGTPQGARARGDSVIAMDEVTVGARFNRYGPKPGESPFVQQNFLGRIAELLIFDRALSDDEIRGVEAYLLGKHGPGTGRALTVNVVGRPPVPADAPAVQMLVPGFAVRELPVELTNINNVEFAPDGRLFAAGYDGRLHVLRDADGDGLEEKITSFLDTKSEDYPLGIAFRERSLYVVRRDRIVRHDDTDGDGTPDRERLVASWKGPDVPAALRDARRVSGGLGIAIGPDGALYTSLGSLNTFNAYMLAKPDGTLPRPGERSAPEVASRYDLTQTAGAVLSFAPGSDRPAIFATGVRYLTSMQFNRRGDLFATDQEGATWVPNGNPFDELLEIRRGRHYGFPARHPRYLPGVIDEPSVYDYAPQHESTCGFRFDEPRTADAAIWGPGWWEGDAIVTGESRGKLFRTSMVKTPAGYVARNQLLACLASLPVDVALSPKGDLVVACHSGEPDWGSGPGGVGHLYKISMADPAAPQPVLAWAASATETCVVFDRPLDAGAWRNLVKGTHIEGGRYVAAGDRFERLRPGYAVVQAQGRASRYELPVVSAALGDDGRSLLLRTAARTAPVSFSITLPTRGDSGDVARRVLSRVGGMDLGFDLTGVDASWRPVDGSPGWSGWLPHPDWTVASGLTAASQTHARLRDLVTRPGVLTLSGRLDLGSMLHPAVQPGSRLDFEYPRENVTVTFAAGSRLSLETGGAVRAEPTGETSARLTATTTADSSMVPFTLTLATGPRPPSLSVTWSTADDPRPRALPLRRILMPWVTPTELSDGPPTTATEIAGGDWEAGRRLFFSPKLNCAGCHAIRGEGGKVGPELTNLVHRDYTSVLKDIHQPGAAINPDFLSYTVGLEDGRVLTGVLSGSTPDQVTVVGPDAKSKTFPRGQVSEIVPSKTSVMPDKLLDGLTDTEVRDLMTFLLSDAPPSRSVATPRPGR
jgi:putative heme-binding domain-containing protein